jgi:GT2 family glycosyltransferase
MHPVFSEGLKKEMERLKSHFDESYYLSINADVEKAGVDPLEHYCTLGWKELRNPSPIFSTAFYLASNPDVAQAGVNPFWHYIVAGKAEGRESKNPGEYEVLKLKNLSTVDFIRRLFQVALRRVPATHEESYYSHLLDSSSNTRCDIADIVLNGEECKSIHVKNEANLFKSKDFVLPLPGDLRPEEIVIPLHLKPLVSVLIPHYTNLEYTLHCLNSIADHLPIVSFEVLILDDLSPDDSAFELEKVENIQVIRNPKNLGFTLSCNYGAQFAKGEYLFFLNNDTEVTSGWLDELINTFNYFPNCGMVGSKLMYPNGALQEAGCILWDDGSAWNYGREKDPKRPEYNYAREVDYCSGAAILIKKALFFELGCFDERYTPAYCEDSDLGLAVRNAGYNVIYQPLSEIIHFEGISNGKTTNAGLKKYQIANITKQFTKWEHVLSGHRENGNKPLLEKDRDVVGRVLLIDACTPTPDQDSGSIDIYNIMIMLRGLGYAVTFIPEDNFADFGEYTKDLQRRGIQAIYHPYCTDVGDHLREFGDHYDLVMIFRSTVASKCLQTVQELAKSAKVVFNTVDLHFLRMEREAAIKNDLAVAADAKRMKELELDLMRRADISTIISDHEMNFLKEIDPSLRVFHLPYSRDIVDKVAPFEARDGILFVGGFQHQPNVDAVIFFVSEIWPLVVKDLPNAKFHIVGSKAPIEIQNLASQNIIFHGFVQDLNPLLQSVKVNIVPLRYGAGIKGKLGGAMAAGLPSVSTKMGAEGMGLKDKVNGVLIDDRVDEIAKNIIKIHRDRTLWRRLSKAGIHFADNQFGKKRLHSNLMELFKIVNAPYKNRA